MLAVDHADAQRAFIFSVGGCHFMLKLCGLNGGASQLPKNQNDSFYDELFKIGL